MSTLRIWLPFRSARTGGGEVLEQTAEVPHEGAPAPAATESADSVPRAVPAPPQRIRSAPLATRMILASAVLALLIGGVFAAFLVATLSLRDSTTGATHSKDLGLAALRLEANVVDIESALRGYVLTGQHRFLGPLNQSRRELPAHMEALRRLAHQESTQSHHARDLTADIRSYVDDYVVPLILIEKVDPAAARSMTATGEGKQRTDEILARFNRFLALDNQRVSAKVKSANDTARMAIALGAAGLAASTLLVLVFGLYLARSIARPVMRAADGANRLAAGDLSLRLSGNAPGELGELTRAFNSMAESIEQGRTELQAQNEQLRESERIKSELVSIVSHEVRTPLASVLGFTSLLLQHDFDEESRRRYLGIIDSQARRLAELVEDFLDARRLEEGRLELRLEPLDVSALLREQVEVFSGQSGLHEFRLDVAPEPLVVDGDPRRLAQVVANLFSNAIKYSPEGGIVRVQAGRNGESVRVSVSDDGLGIPDEQHGQVFTKFFRGDAAARGISGTGLGLVLSREIIEAHGGELRFASSSGQGSTFWFQLPAADTGGV